MASAVLLDFSSDFGSISSGKFMFFQTWFPNGACFFFEMATLTIVRFYRLKATFSFFVFARFFEKQCKKTKKKREGTPAAPWVAGEDKYVTLVLRVRHQ